MPNNLSRTYTERERDTQTNKKCQKDFYGFDNTNNGKSGNKSHSNTRPHCLAVGAHDSYIFSPFTIVI